MEARKDQSGLNQNELFSVIAIRELPFVNVVLHIFSYKIWNKICQFRILSKIEFGKQKNPKNWWKKKMKGLGLVVPSSMLTCCYRKSLFSISPVFYNKHVNYHFQLYQLSNRPFSSSSSSPNFPIKRRRSDSVPAMASSSATDSPAQNVSGVDEPVDLFKVIQAHQEKAARLPPVEEIKTLLYHSLRGMLSTFSQKHDGYPSGSMVDFACDTQGSPILAVSSLAVHTKDLWANSKCSLLVAKDPSDRTELVITVHGDAVPVAESDKEAIRTAYLARHPNAFWVDFGDFQFMRIEPKVVRYVSGVATAALGAGEFSKEEFAAAKVDPIYQFSKPIASHMNKDHEEDTKLIVQHSISVPVDSAYILDVDSLGFNVKVNCEGAALKLRIPFPRQAADRKDVKTLIVEMLQAARDQTN